MISAIILTKNEEENIGKCLESVKWSDEIIIIDDNSVDKTTEIAKKYKTTIYSRTLNNNFSAQRNFGLSKVKNDWALFVDADEIVSDALAYEITNAIVLNDQTLDGFKGFHIRRTDFMWGRQLRYGETGRIKFLRLAKRGSGLWTGMAHERWGIKGNIGTLTNSLLHFPHKNLSDFLKEINFYTDIRAKELRNKNKKVYFWTIMAYPLGKFVVNYFFRKGLLDGVPGLIFAITMSFHSFLVRGKLWMRDNE